MNIKSYKKNSKAYYKFSIYLGEDPLTGKDVRTNRSGFTTKRDAMQVYILLKNQGVVEKIKIYTFKDIYEMWLKVYKHEVKNSTYITAKGRFNNHILPTIGHYRINKIELKHCQDFMHKRHEQFKHNRWLKLCLSQIFRHAIKMGILSNDPAQYAVIPK